LKQELGDDYRIMFRQEQPASDGTRNIEITSTD